MIKKITKVLATTALTVGVIACNSEADVTDIIYATDSSALISSFSLEANEDILDNLDSVFFSIDAVNGRIYNADSLPYGTRVTGLVPVISTDNARIVELSIPRANNTDTIVDYLSNTTDSVNFSRGPVKVRVVSYDGLCERTYQVSVNVHQVKPDTLVWDRVGQSNLPSLFIVPAQQRTAQSGDRYYCLTTSDGKYSLAKADNPAGPWTVGEFKPTFTPDVESMTGTPDALYILSTDNKLYRSINGGDSWTAVADDWKYIYGGYGTTLWGARYADGRWYRVTYPGGKQEDMPSAFPVSGTSLPITYTYEMSDTPQMLITGGRRADGSLVAGTWGYDGNSWQYLTQQPLDYALSDAVVVPYFVSKVNTNTWKASRSSVILAMFGSRANGTLNDTVYLSPDMGINWVKAPEQMQISGKIPARAKAQGFVAEQTLSVDSKAVASFRDTYMARLPIGARWIEYNDSKSRVIKPVTTWECPYIYIFGGAGADNQTYNTIWRGVIRRFTFKPLY